MLMMSTVKIKTPTYKEVTKENNLLAKSIERNGEGDTIETTWTGEAF